MCDIDTKDSNSCSFPPRTPRTSLPSHREPPRALGIAEGECPCDPSSGCPFHSPRGIQQTLSHQLQLPLCPCQLLLKLLGQASLFTVIVLFLLQIKDTLRNRRFVGSCFCGSKDIMRTLWVSTPIFALLQAAPALVKIPWTHSRMIASEFLEVAPPKLCTLLSSPGNSWAH